MFVTTNTGTYSEETRDLASVLSETYNDMWEDQRADFLWGFISILVEKGILTLSECQALGAPHMEKAE